MKINVEPTMGAVFRGHDPTRYASFGCTTCHGPENKAPRDFLPRLTMKSGQITAFAKKLKIAENVAPRMAAAMGLSPYDSKTRQGFGYGGCHTIDMNDGRANRGTA